MRNGCHAVVSILKKILGAWKGYKINVVTTVVLAKNPSKWSIWYQFQKVAPILFLILFWHARIVTHQSTQKLI